MSQSALERAAHAVELLIESHCPACEAQLAGDPVEIARAVLDALMTPTPEMLMNQIKNTFEALLVLNQDVWAFCHTLDQGSAPAPPEASAPDHID